MKIIYATAELPYTNQEAFIIPEILEMQGQGQDIRIVPRSPQKTISHADARPLASQTIAESLLSGAVLRGALQQIMRHPIRSLRALALLGHSPSPKKLLRNLAVFPKGLWLAGIAKQWGAEHIHAHWAATVSTMVLVASEVSGIPWSFTAHRFDIVENNLLACKIRRATLARFISESGRGIAHNFGIHDETGTSRVLYMGVNLPPRKYLSAADKFCTVLCPANLIPVKGHTYLITAVALLKTRGIPFCLWIAGHGECEAALRQQVVDLDVIDRVRFLGQLSHAEVLGFYRQGEVDGVVLPSIELGNGLHEGIPVALLEAMAYGLPVVSTCTGGIPELMEGGAGMLVPPGDAEALAQALGCLQANPVMRKNLGEAGRRRIEERFDVACIANELITQFQRAKVL